MKCARSLSPKTSPRLALALALASEFDGEDARSPAGAGARMRLLSGAAKTVIDRLTVVAMVR
jgi:hypothetical protein